MESAQLPDWAVTPEKVEMAVRKIVEIGMPRKIILFGSFVRGNITVNSDLDVLVIPESQWMELKDRPGMIFREASREGTIVYES